MKNQEIIKTQIKIITLGNSGVGKTSFVMRYIGNIYDDYQLSTNGFEIQTKHVKRNGKIYQIDFYDTAGQETYKSIASSFIKNANGIILMYDISNKKSFDEINEWMNDIINIKGADFPIILIGNKCDLENREVEFEEGENFANENGLKFMETSNKNNTNIEEAGKEIINMILDKKEKEEKLLKNDDNENRIPLEKDSNLKGKRSCCCL